MDSIVHQLGELFLGATPTALLVLIFYFIFRTIFFKPLLAVMAEREARTAGAQKEAEAAQAAAAEKVQKYQDALKDARARVYAEQEAARKVVLDERAALLKDARAKAAGEVDTAKTRIEADLAAARRQIETAVGQLASEIVRRVLQPKSGPSSPAREAR
ncbi:MAG TPA: ATP synthase F0 subunit B [Candidatus Acidoferrum sp.]|nr:ATP synthase F0 subunit B [Candidatus Acidoferrum sp.]